MKLICLFLPCVFLAACGKDDMISSTSTDELVVYRSINVDYANTTDVLMKDSLRVLDIATCTLQMQ